MMNAIRSVCEKRYRRGSEGLAGAGYPPGAFEKSGAEVDCWDGVPFFNGGGVFCSVASGLVASAA